MSQTGYTPIQLYHSTVSTNVPDPTTLLPGELAINIPDGKLFFKNSGGTTTLIASAAAAAGVLSFNTRTGAVTLTSGDVTTALGYTPYNAGVNTVLTSANYNTYAPTLTGTGASGTWGINISGASNSATTASTATNVAGGATGSLPYQTASGATSLLSIGTSGQVLGVSGGLPTWQTLTTNVATNLAGGTATQIPVQTGVDTTSFIIAPTSSGTFLRWNGTTFDWSSSTATASSISGGAANQLLYQTGTNATSFAAAPTISNSYLNWTGSAFSWVTAVDQAVNINGGSATQIPVQTGVNATSFIVAPTTSGTFLRWNGTSFDWASSTATASSVAGGAANQILFQSGPNATSFITAPSTSGTVLNWNGSAFNFVNTVNSFSAGTTGFTPSTATSGAITLAGTLNVANGGTGVATLTGLAYGNGTSAFTAATGAQIVSAIGATAVTNATNATNIAITNSSSASTFYPVLSATNTGNNAATTSSTTFSFVPSTGILTATGFAGAGTGLTGTATSLSIGGTATLATNKTGGAANQIVYQTGSNTTSFITAPTTGTTYLAWNGSSFVWNTVSAGVTSFNTRTGAVTLSSSDVTTALTYTPVSTSGSYSDPTWITALAGTKISGTVANASLAGNVSGVVAVTNGGTGATVAPSAYGIVYGNSAGNGYTSLSAGTSGYLLKGNGSAAPSFVAPSTLTVGSAVNVTGTVAVANGGTGLTSVGNNSYALRAVNGAWASAKIGLGATGEIWNNVTSSRTSGTTYTNSYYYPIEVSITYVYSAGSNDITVLVNGITILLQEGAANNSFIGSVSFIVPAGATYSATIGNTIQNWVELY